MNEKLLHMDDRPHEALAILKVNQDWNLSPIGLIKTSKIYFSEKSFLQSYAVSEKDTSELFEYVSKIHPPISDKIKKEWKAALFDVFSILGSVTNEKNFMKLFDICTPFLDKSDMQIIMLKIISFKKNWSASVKKIMDETDYDWNEPIPYSILKKVGVDEIDNFGKTANKKLFSFNQMLFIPSFDIYFLDLVKEREVFVHFVEKGFDIDKNINGNTLRKSIKEREPWTFIQGEKEKQSILSYIDKHIPYKWDKDTVWNALTLHDFNGIGEILSNCSSDIWKWRGEMGETFAHHVAMYSPNSLHAILNHKEVPKNYALSKDNLGMGIEAWWLSGVTRSGQKIWIPSLLESLKEQEIFKSPKTDKDAAKLSLDVFVTSFNPFFTSYGKDLVSKSGFDKEKLDFFLSMEKSMAHSGLWLNINDNSTESVDRHNDVLNQMVYELLNKNTINGEKPRSGFREAFIGALLEKVKSLSRGNPYSFPEDVLWSKWGEMFLETPKDKLDTNSNNMKGEYLAYSLMVKNIYRNPPDFDIEQWSKAIKLGADPKACFDSISEDNKYFLSKSDWYSKLEIVSERHQLTKIVNSPEHKPAVFTPL